MNSTCKYEQKISPPLKKYQFLNFIVECDKYYKFKIMENIFLTLTKKSKIQGQHWRLQNRICRIRAGFCFSSFPISNPSLNRRSYSELINLKFNKLSSTSETSPSCWPTNFSLYSIRRDALLHAFDNALKKSFSLTER